MIRLSRAPRPITSAAPSPAQQETARARAAYHARLIRRWQKHGDIRARDTAIMAVARMVYRVADDCAKRYAGKPLPGTLSQITADDLHSILWEMVVRGADLYNPNCGASWSTYCANRIKLRAKNLLARENRLIHIPAHFMDGAAKGDGARKRFAELAQVRVAASLCEPVSGEASDIDHQALYAWRKHAMTDAGYGESETTLFFEQVWKRTPLSKREQVAFLMRLNGVTLESIGAHFGISRECARHAAERAKTKLRQSWESAISNEKGQAA